MTEFCTAFRKTATLSDPSGRYRTSIVLASRLNGEWSAEAVAEQVKREALPMKGLRLTAAEYDALDANPALLHGYVDAPGDVESPFTPEEWQGWR